MAKKFLTSLDLNKNQLLNAVIHSLSSAPSSPVAGQIYYNTGDNTLRYWNGTTWLTLAQGGSVEDAINAIVNELTTDDIEEGSSNLYFTNQRAIDAVGGSATSENTANTVVKRDSSGNFAAGTVTASRVTYGGAGYVEDDGSLIVTATDSDLRLNAADDIRLYANDDITIESVNGQITLDVGNGEAFIGINDPENKIATEGYVDTAAGNAYDNAVSYADNLTTNDIGEGDTNLYFSESRARTSISSGNNTISYNSSTGEITANTSTMATVSYVDGEITDLTTYVDQEISDSANTLTTAYEAADETLSDNLTAAYQLADNAIVSSLTQDFNDADNTVIETLRGEIAAASEGLDIKNSVLVATTANINLTAGTPVGSIDGVSLAYPSTTRVLVKNQTNAAQNGIYDLVQGSTGNTWTRSDDALELTAGTFVFVEQGTENGDHGYVISTDGPIVVGTTNITWTQFSGAGRIIAGNGITKTGDTLSVTAHDGITVSASGVSISNTYAGQSSITTVGTIGTGVWEGTAIGLAHGGTGADLSEEAVGNYVVVGATGALETSSTVAGGDVDGDISGNAENVNGTVAIANGGTGATTAAGARSNLSATTKYAANNTTLNPVSNTITWTVSHNINTTDVTVQMRDLLDGALVEADVLITNANTVTISWYSGATVSADAYRVVVVG
jgi:hypothetical protein